MRGRSLLMIFVAASGLAVAYACGSDSGHVADNRPDSSTSVPPPFGSVPESGLSASIDTDEDGIPDALDGDADDDGDGTPNYLDPVNDGPPPALTLVSISTSFNQPIGIDYHEPTNTVVMSVNYPTGNPLTFERVELTGEHRPFSALTGVAEEVKIATVRSGGNRGFVVGDLFTGNGVDGQIMRISEDGAKVINPWVDLPGNDNGLLRGSLYVDRTGVFGGDLIAVTTRGEVWRVTPEGVPTRIAVISQVHLEGLVVVPDKPARFGPLAGKILAGGEETHLVYAIAADGTVAEHKLDVDVEDIDIVGARENFFGVEYGNGTILGANAAQWAKLAGDVLLVQEHVTAGSSGLFRAKWNGTQVIAEPIPLSQTSRPVGQWEHVTFARAGIAEVPAVN